MILNFRLGSCETCGLPAAFMAAVPASIPALLSSALLFMSDSRMHHKALDWTCHIGSAKTITARIPYTSWAIRKRSGKGMLPFLGLATVLLLLAAILSKRVSPLVALVCFPVAAALLGG